MLLPPKLLAVVFTSSVFQSVCPVIFVHHFTPLNTLPVLRSHPYLSKFHTSVWHCVRSVLIMWWNSHHKKFTYFYIATPTLTLNLVVINKHHLPISEIYAPRLFAGRRQWWPSSVVRSSPHQSLRSEIVITHYPHDQISMRYNHRNKQIFHSRDE